MMLCGALTAIPMLTACFYPETLSDLAAFAIPALSSLIAGAVVCLKNQPQDNEAPRPQRIKKGSFFVCLPGVTALLSGRCRLFWPAGFPGFRVCLNRSAAGQRPDCR